MSPARPKKQPRRPSPRRNSDLNINVSGADRALTKHIELAARAALHSQRYKRGDLHINVIGRAEMCRQHARWMNDPSPTDVLTFDLRERPAKGVVDGEILVCETVARREARRRKTDWRSELILYVVHGSLHLCGYDDHTGEESAAMHALEDRILVKLGWGRVFAPKLPAKGR